MGKHLPYCEIDGKYGPERCDKFEPSRLYSMYMETIGGCERMSGICDTCQRNQVCRKPMDGMDSCRLYISGKESNYKRLFGTPERAARTLAVGDRHADCSECVICEACYSSDMGCLVEEPDVLLEWLESEVRDA